MGTRHDTSQRRPFLEVLHELWELSVELTIVVLPVFESLVIVEWLVTPELLMIVAVLVESMELETLAEPLLASTVFPLPSEIYAPAAYAPDAQSASAMAVTRDFDFIEAPVRLWRRLAVAQLLQLRDVRHIHKRASAVPKPLLRSPKPERSPLGPALYRGFHLFS